MKLFILCISVLCVAISSSAAKAQQTQFRECLDWIESYSSSDDSDQPWILLINYFGTLVPSSRSTSYSEVSQLTSLRHNLLDLQIEKLRLRALLVAHINSSLSGVSQYDQAINALPEIIRRTNYILNDLREMSKNGNLFAAQDAFADLVLALSVEKRAIVCDIEFPPIQSIQDQTYIISIINAIDDELKLIDRAETSLAEYVRQLRQ